MMLDGDEHFVALDFADKYLRKDDAAEIAVGRELWVFDLNGKDNPAQYLHNKAEG